MIDDLVATLMGKNGRLTAFLGNGGIQVVKYRRLFGRLELVW